MKAKLTPNEEKTLAHLKEREGNAVTHGELLELLWPGEGKKPKSNVLQVLISNLRKKTGVIITAKNGVGYRYWSA